MRRAIYALSADPITYGHIDVIERALRIFDDLIVAVGNNAQKKYTFTLDERVSLVKKVLDGFSVRVMPFEGLLVDFAYHNNVTTVVRGVRNSADFEFEQVLHDINYGQRMGVDTILIIADQQLSHVSSSAVKELQTHAAKEILDYVPMGVKQALEERLCRQVRVGITGEIGAGKSFLSAAFASKPRLFGMRTLVADLDVIAKDILTKNKDPLSTRLQAEVCERYGLTDEDLLDVKKWSWRVFSNDDNREWYNEVMNEPILHFLRRDYLSQKDCIVLVGGALLADFNGLDIVNNNAILVTADKQERAARLKARGYSDQQVLQRMDAQLDAAHKREIIKSRIEVERHGSLLELDTTNTDEATLAENLARMEKWIKSLVSYVD